MKKNIAVDIVDCSDSKFDFVVKYADDISDLSPYGCEASIYSVPYKNSKIHSELGSDRGSRQKCSLNCLVIEIQI